MNANRQQVISNAETCHLCGARISGSGTTNQVAWKDLGAKMKSHMAYHAESMRRKRNNYVHQS